MKFLVWDTSSKVGCLAAFEAEDEERKKDSIRLVGEWMMNVEAGQSEKLLWGIHYLLQSCHWDIRDIDIFGVGRGPGSFTGLRIGVTTARTFGMSLNKPVVAVSSLAALIRPVAKWARELDSKAWVIGAIDASKGDWFVRQGSASHLLKNSHSVIERAVGPAAFLDEFLENQGRNQPWVAVGETIQRYPEMWKKFPQKFRLKYPFSQSELIQGRFLAEAVWDSFCRNGAQNALEVFPQYLRVSSAELQFAAIEGHSK